MSTYTYKTLHRFKKSKDLTVTSLYTNFYVKKYWHERVFRNRKQHIITEILGLSPARTRIWQQRLLAEAATGSVLLKKVVLRNFEKFTGKRLCQSLFFSKVAGLRPATLLKKRLWHRCFPAKFPKFLRAPLL